MLRTTCNLGYHSPVSKDTGTANPVEAVINRMACESDGGFLTSGALIYGGPDGETERFTGASPDLQTRSGLSPFTAKKGDGTQTVTEAITMTTVTTGTTTATSELSIITPELTNTNGQITTTSTQVAQHFSKSASVVNRAIRNLLAELPKEHACNFAPMLQDVEIGNGATRQDPAYRLTRDGFTLLAMGFTGKEALQWKLAYITAFNKMEAELVKIEGPALTEYISSEQRVHLQELVDLVVESGRQKTHGETWARFHRKMKVPKYDLLPSFKFDAACEYLRGKMDDASIAAIAAKHFPQLAQLPAPAMKNPEAPTLPFSVDTLCSFLSSGMVEKSSLLKVATTSGKSLYITVANDAKPTGWGQQVADQIDDTLPQDDLNIIVTKAVLELWTRNLMPPTAGRPVPQRVTH